jgi:protein-L-isoaspartate(D-aspartate) O-methyltransferase
MLEQAQITPGMRCLEIGSGGYNAALMAELVSPTGAVTTVDIDPYVTERARRFLAATGYDHVQVVLRDAEQGVVEHSPYDRILVTVGVWDVPPAWREQLAPHGRIVVPLRMRGLSRSVTLEDDGARLVSVDHQMAGFVSVQGEGAHAERLITLHAEDVGLRFDEEEPSPDDEVSLRQALLRPRTEVWSDAASYRCCFAARCYAPPDRSGTNTATSGSASPGCAPHRPTTCCREYQP